MQKMIVDMSYGSVYCSEQGVVLTPAEIKLISILKSREGKVVSADILEEELNNDPTGNTFSSVSFHISTLRAKLGHTKDRPIILTKAGIGYMLLGGIVGVVE